MWGIHVLLHVRRHFFKSICKARCETLCVRSLKPCGALPQQLLLPSSCLVEATFYYCRAAYASESDAGSPGAGR